jgi:hypothetical protein
LKRNFIPQNKIPIPARKRPIEAMKIPKPKGEHHEWPRPAGKCHGYILVLLLLTQDLLKSYLLLWGKSTLQ